MSYPPVNAVSRLLLAALLLPAACGSSDDNTSQGGPSTKTEELVVQSANYDLAAGEKSRMILGLLTPDQLFVSYGTVDVELFYLGTRQGSGTAEAGPTVTAAFLPIEGEAAQEGPVAAPGSMGRGVYAAEVIFDRAGFWAAEVTADVEGGELSGRTVFEVRDEHRFPAPAERAPKTENLTIASKDAPRAAIDSRAHDGEAIPDEELHRMTIAESIARKEPALVVFSTPVYCISRFCGPITDMIQKLSHEYSDRANFIHVEVWRNYEGQVVNKGAADWIYRDNDLLEPWVYLIGADGVIEQRWDNVATRGEIEPFLKELPPLR